MWGVNGKEKKGKVWRSKHTVKHETSLRNGKGKRKIEYSIHIILRTIIKSLIYYSKHVIESLFIPILGPTGIKELILFIKLLWSLFFIANEFEQV